MVTKLTLHQFYVLFVDDSSNPPAWTTVAERAAVDTASCSYYLNKKKLTTRMNTRANQNHTCN
uniref:Uncharacterized protein n=1 Tax=Romanomermis culicivorax TaxID=13658 RepID=A0A915IVQ7_ROMCU